MRCQFYDILYGLYCIMIFTLMIKNAKLLYFLSFFSFMLDLMTPYYLHSLLNNGFQMPGQDVVMWYFIYISVIRKDIGRLDFGRETWSVGLPQCLGFSFTFSHTLVQLLYTVKLV
jgi:hypothetical protein